MLESLGTFNTADSDGEITVMPFYLSFTRNISGKRFSFVINPGTIDTVIVLSEWHSGRRVSTLPRLSIYDDEKPVIKAAKLAIHNLEVRVGPEHVRKVIEAAPVINE